jgi:hypothetical protein
MNRLTRTILYAVASGLAAVVVTVILIGLLTKWDNTQRSTFIQDELAWFGVFAILNGVSEWYREKARPSGT